MRRKFGTHFSEWQHCVLSSQPQGDHLHMIFTLHQPPGSTFCGLPVLLSPGQVPEARACQFTGLLSLDITALAFSLSLPVPFDDHWRAPSVLPRIFYATPKIIWEAGIDPTALEGVKRGSLLTSCIPPDPRKSGKEGARSSMAASWLGATGRRGESSALPHSRLPWLSEDGSSFLSLM